MRRVVDNADPGKNLCRGKARDLLGGVGAKQCSRSSRRRRIAHAERKASAGAASLIEEPDVTSVVKCCWF